jgi:hypothetical protein
MPEIIQRSFTGGEIAPALRTRADINKYSSGLAKLENMFVRTQGGAYSREGTKFISEVGDSTKRPRLIPFSFNTEQTYVLLFEQNTLRFYRNGGLVLEGDGITIYEIATPYLESELSRLSFTQRADVMTLVHPDHAPRNLSRTADNAWTLSVIDFAPTVQPPEFVVSINFSISNVTQANPAVVITTTPHGLESGDSVSITSVLGMTQLNGNAYIISYISATTFSLDETDSTGYGAYTSAGIVARDPTYPVGDGFGDFNKTYTYVITSVGFDGTESIASLPQSRESASLSETGGIRLQWNVVSNASYYRIYKDPSKNTGAYGFIGTSLGLTFDDFNLAPIISDAPPQLRDPFTDKSGVITDLNLIDLTVTVSATHELVSGEVVYIDGILQPTDFNGGFFNIRVIDETSFRLVDTGVVGPFLPYTSGGTFLKEGQQPATVNYYQQRLVFGNTDEQKQTVFTSQTGNFDSFRTSSPSRADDAITFTLAGREVNEIRHIIELDAMMLLTSGGVWRVTEGQDRVLTPATVGVRKQSNKGASYVAPVISDATIIYVQSNGARLRDLNYAVEADNFRGDDLSIMAQHLLEGFEIQEMVLADEPYGILWMVRNDGKMLGLTYQRQQQVWGWHQHVTDGTFESVTSVMENNRDAVYVVVNRTIEGVTRRYVERMEPRDVTAPENVWCVDSGLQYVGVAADNISGLDHLEGKEVAVVADGNVVTGLTVVSGAITLPREASKVTVGLGYTCTMDTLDLDLPQMKQVLKAKDVNINEVTVVFENSRGASAGSLRDDGTADMQEFKPRYDDFGYGAIPLSTWQESLYTAPTWGVGGGMRIQQTNPMPMAVLAVIPNVDIS